MASKSLDIGISDAIHIHQRLPSDTVPSDANLMPLVVCQKSRVKSHLQVSVVGQEIKENFIKDLLS